MKGVLLVNLGSPDSPHPKDVKKYLREFLMDKRVIDTNIILRNILVKGIILNTRPKKSAAAYQKIWWKEGSPLIIISERLKKKLEEKTNIPIALGMRYGSMSIQKGYETLQKKGVQEVLLIPLYPHYAMSSYETVVVKAQQINETFFPKIKTSVFPVFYNQPNYIAAMCENIKKNLENFEYDHILFSYHGIPERHIFKTDPTKGYCKIHENCCQLKDSALAKTAHSKCYKHQCLMTTEYIVGKLNIEKYSNAFQSRLGSDPWLKPYTDFELGRLAKEKNIKNLAVVTPAFVSDCLETLEEIAMEGKEEFIKAGGKNFKHIPCLNDDAHWVDCLQHWIEEWA